MTRPRNRRARTRRMRPTRQCPSLILDRAAARRRWMTRGTRHRIGGGASGPSSMPMAATWSASPSPSEARPARTRRPVDAGAGLNDERPAQVVAGQKVEGSLASHSEGGVQRAVDVVAGNGHLVPHGREAIARGPTGDHLSVRLNPHGASVGVERADLRRDDARTAETSIEGSAGQIAHEPELPAAAVPGNDDSSARRESHRVGDVFAWRRRHDDAARAEARIESAAREIANEGEVRLGVRSSSRPSRPRESGRRRERRWPKLRLA